mmetsp:Transcript_8764/g.17819  ORF Transcript_8764/g.17819 Transcript_8764/m.17819 type:complete len:315 (-) Transcript_8764:752-1696(-)
MAERPVAGATGGRRDRRSVPLAIDERQDLDGELIGNEHEPTSLSRCHRPRDLLLVGLDSDLILSRTVAGVSRLENMETVASRAAHHPWHLRMPMQFLDVGLPLVYEVKLGRDVLQVVAPRMRSLRLWVRLEREIPQGQLIIRASDANRGRLVRRPLDGGDGAPVPSEVRDRLARLEGAKVPDAEGAIVTSCHDEVVDQLIPRENVDVLAVTFIHRQCGATLAARVPHPHRRVTATAHQHVLLDGRPRNVLDRARVPLIGLWIDYPRAALYRVPHVHSRGTVSARKEPRLGGGEVERKPLICVAAEGEERFAALF